MDSRACVVISRTFQRPEVAFLNRMSTGKWQIINDLFHAALQLDPSERAEYLRNQCSDEDVREEVLSLLSAHHDAGDFIQTPISAIQNVWNDPEPDALKAGETIGAYQVLKQIGHGGMGAVYLGVRADQTYEKHVAVKLLKPGMDTAEVLRHFRNERQILADFDHPNIARLLDGGTTQSGLPYLVMEYVEGVPVDVYCDQHRLSIQQRLELFRQICAAVSYAHRHLVIHRDIKPSNILVTSEGVPKLLDFGIAKILHPERQSGTTATGIRLMTPEYASPEQVLGLPVTTVSDVYSLGVLLYELVTGTLPYQFQSRSPLEIARVIQETQPLAASSALDADRGQRDRMSDSRNTTVENLKRGLRGDLDNILAMALRKEPHRRYQSVEQFSEDIRRHLERLPVIARKDTMFYRISKFTTRNPVAVVAGVLVFVTLLGGVIATTWQARKAKAEQVRSEYARQFADELRYIESLLLSTYTSPLHDARPAFKIARERLAHIEQQMLQEGELASGSGSNALGNGYLMLKDFQRAKSHLERAWNAGYQEPATAYALGKVLGHLYLQTITQAAKVSNSALKDKMIREAERDFAQPAIYFLNNARTFSESPAYVEGLIALYKKQYEVALQKAAEALKTSSRPYEVMKLEGDIYVAMTLETERSGDESRWLQNYNRAGTAYRRASESARSDPDIYLADAGRMMRGISSKSQSARELVNEAIASCDKALQINPDSDLPFLHKAEIHIQEGIYQMYSTAEDPRPAFRMAILQAKEAERRKDSGTSHERASTAYLRLGEYETANDLDPRTNLHQAVDESQKASAINPHSYEVQLGMAAAYFLLSEYHLVRGEDPTEYLREIIHLYDTKLRTIPKDAYSYNLLGLAHLGLGEFKVKRGLDPEKDFENAVAEFREGIRKIPPAQYLLEGIALTYVGKGKHEMANGIDPEKSFAEAIRLYDQYLATSLKGWSVFNRGVAYLTQAEYRVKVHRDPSQEIQNALRDFKAALDLLPNLSPAILQLAAVHVLQARHRITSGSNAKSDLERAADLLSKIGQQDSASPERDLIEGRMHFAYALWQLRKTQNADRYFDQAVTALNRANQRNPGETAPLLELASVYLKRAESSSNASIWIEKGLESLKKAEMINPHNAEISALRASFLHLASRIQNDPELESEASRLMWSALQKNANLRFEYSLK